MHHFDSLASLTEVKAVKSHFRSVLWFLRQRRPAGLDPAQKAARALLLDELEVYAARGVFPLNTQFPGERRPTFIDEAGTRCAVAHLLDMSGEESLALEVRDRMNFAPVSEIAEDLRIGAWLEAAGFTREEIALVQPSYCSDTPSSCVCDASIAENADFSLVSYRSTRAGLVVTEVHRGVPSIEVGLRIIGPGDSSEAKASPSPTSGNEIERIAWVGLPMRNRADEMYTRLVPASELTVENGGIRCSSMGARSLPLSKELAVKALLSPSPDACRAYLTSLDERWDDTSCPSQGGCDMTPLVGSSPASLAVLAAIVGAIAARRRR